MSIEGGRDMSALERRVWNEAIQAAWEQVTSMTRTLPAEPRTTAVQLMRDTSLDIADAVLALKVMS